MAKRGAALRGPLAQALLVGLLVVGTWAYAVLIFDPISQERAAQPGQTPGPYATDLYPSWYAAYALLQQGRDPYTPAVTADIQRGFFGRVLAPDDPVQITEAFVYPLYTVFLLAPLTLLPFDILKPVLYVLWPALAALTVLWWIAALGWRPGGSTRARLALFGCSAIPTIAAFLLQQPSVLVAALLAGAAYCLWRGTPRVEEGPLRGAAGDRRWYGAAGALLACATIKPQLSGIFILWLLLWAAADWRRRGGLLLGFGGMLAALLAGAFALVPGWVDEWRAALADYTRYATDRSILDTWLPPLLAAAALVLLAGALALFAWRTRAAQPGSLAFSLGYAFAGLFSILAFPGWAAYNQLILFPAALLVMQQAGALRAAGRGGRLLYILTFDLLLWPWVAATGLLLVWLATRLTGQPSPLVAAGYLLPWVTSLITPILLLAPLGLLAWGVARAPRRTVEDTVAVGPTHG
jgi:hypothetical protein